jgi:hypothetical protein
MLGEWGSLKAKFIVFKEESDGVNVFVALLGEMQVFFLEYLASARNTSC